MLDSLREQLYPCLLVTKMEIFKVALVTNPVDHQKKLLNFLQIPDIDSQSLWEYARNIIWTYNTFAARCMLDEKPAEAMKIFRIGMKLLDLKDPCVDWSTRDEWKLLKIIFMRNMAYFYCKFINYEQAIAQLLEVEKMQNTVSKEMRYKIDTDSPFLVLAYLHLVGNEIEKAEKYSKKIADQVEEPHVFRRPEFMEPSLVVKKEGVLKTISNFILGKCHIHKKEYKDALDRYRQGVAHLKSCDMFDQTFKSAILEDCNLIRTKLKESKKPAPLSEESKQNETVKTENNENYPEIKLPKNYSHRALKVQANRSESNIQFHSPQARFSFGVDAQIQSAAALPKMAPAGKGKSTARFNKSTDKVESAVSIDSLGLDHTKGLLSVKNTPKLKPAIPDQRKPIKLEIKNQNFFDILNPRPQTGTFRRTPSIASDILAPNSATSRKNFISKNSLNYDSKLAENADYHKNAYSSHGYVTKLPSLVDRVEGAKSFARGDESDIKDLVELMDYLDDKGSSRSSIKVHESETLTLEATKVESIATFMNSLSSMDFGGDLKKEERSTFNAKEFTLNIFKRISNKERESDTIKNGLPTSKKFFDDRPGSQEEKNKDEPAFNFKELKIQIREAEKLCASRIQRWWRKVAKTVPLKLDQYAISNHYNNKDRDNNTNNANYRDRRPVKNLTISNHTLTVTQTENGSSKEESRSRQTPQPTTIQTLQVSKGVERNFRLTANAILINDNYIDSQPEVIPERSDRSFAPDLLTPSPLLPITRVSLASPQLLMTGRTENFNRMSSRDFSLLATPVPSVREPKTPISRIDKLEDQKGPMDISDGASTLRSKNQKRSQRKYRPGFKDNSNNETQFNQQSYIRSRTSIRSKSITEKSLLLRYDPSKLPEEINKGIKFRIMRKYAEIKESQHIWLRFNKAFMSKDEVWFFRYNGNSWDCKNKEKKDLVLNLQLCNTSRQSAEIRIPFFYTEEVQTDRSVTVWPIIFPSIKNWFLAQNFEDEYEQFNSRQLQNFPKRMYRRIEKALTHRGFKTSQTKTKLTSDDKKIFQEIQKRLIFLIEKKIIKVSKINGESLIVGKSSFGEKLQAINRRQVEKEQAIKGNSKIIEVGQSLPTHESEKTEDRIFYPPPPGTLTDLLEVEKRCFNERIEELKEREIKRVEARMPSDRKRVTFMEEYDLKDAKYSSYNFLSSTIVFRSIFKLKNFYWLYITSKVIGVNHEGQARRNIEIIVEPGTIKSLASKRRGDSRNSYKTFNFSEGEFMEKCMDFLEINGIKLQSLYKMKHYFKFELEKRLNKFIVEQGDRIKLSSKFQNIEEQDDPFAKASAYHRLTEKSVFQDFNFDKSVFAFNDNDRLFEKNFKEIYGKHFINEAQKFFNHKSYNDEDDKEQLDIMDENDQDMIYKQRYIDDDEVLVGGNKPEVDVLDSTIVLAENSEPCRRYFTYNYQGSICYIRLICDTDLAGKNYIEISYYHPNRGQLNYANISERKLLKKIRSILGRESKVIQLRLLQSLIEYGISSVGRVLHVKSTSYDVNLIQRKYAIPVNPAYLKIDMLNQSSNLESAFEIWTLNFMHKFDDALGRCYVKLLVYRKKVLIMTDNITPDMNLYHFSFEINPEKSKTRQYRLLLNSYDLKTYLNIKIEGDSPFYFTKLSRTVLEKFILWKRPTSKVLALPIIRTNQEIPDNPSLYVFYNTFSINSFETKMKITNYLEPKNYAPKIIYQGVRKFGKNFYIVTIEYVHRFDYWNILIYNPKTSRNFVTIIFFEEILGWKNSFLKKLYPSFLNEFKKHNFKNYQQFTTTYVRHFKKVKKASEVKFTSTVDIPSSKRGMFAPISTAEFESLNKKERQLFFKIDRVYSLPFLRRKKNQSKVISSRHHTDDSSREDLLNNIDFYEFKFWESVVKNLEFAEDASGRDIVKIDNFEGKLSELIFVSAIQIDKSVDCLVEIHIENNHENKFLNSPFENITYLSSIHNILYIKIFFFNLVICQREQLYLREIINLYIADGIYKYQANYIDSKLNLADLQNICGYIIHKIQSSNLLTLLNESPLFSKRFSIQQKSEYRIKIKTNTQTEPDDNMEEKKGIFLFRKVIMTQPMISASVYFDKYRSIFMVYLYRFEDCAMVTKEYKMKSVRKKIPLAQSMMEAGHYPLVGKLILDKNINFLKIYASYTYNVLELFKK